VQATFAEHILDLYKGLKPSWRLPTGIDLIYPFGNSQVWSLMEAFYSKFYSDTTDRYFLFGINPGRLGAGMTGVPFTDPIHLKTACDIDNEVKKKHELSSIFIYSMIEELGGVQEFYSRFYISSLCPLGFTKDGKNYNYYDSKELYKAVKPEMVKAIKLQISKYCKKDKAYSLGQGKNYKVFHELNEQYKWFNEIIPLPHPRWVMQYKRKTMQIYLDEYKIKLLGTEA